MMFEVIARRDYEADQVLARVSSKERADKIVEKFSVAKDMDPGDLFLAFDEICVKELSLFETEIEDWSF